VGIPRSITHTRRAFPYVFSMRSRNMRSVFCSDVFPSITSYAKGNPSGVTTSAITTCKQSGRLSRL
jgi:hypothetical protein